MPWSVEGITDSKFFTRYFTGKTYLRSEEEESGAGEVQVRAGLQDQGAQETN